MFVPANLGSQALQHHSLFDRLGRIDPVMELNFCNKARQRRVLYTALQQLLVGPSERHIMEELTKSADAEFGPCKPDSAVGSGLRCSCVPRVPAGAGRASCHDPGQGVHL